MAERVLRVEDILMRIHERMRRVEDGLMGRSKGEIVDLIRTAAEAIAVTDGASSTEHAAAGFVVGTAEVGFSTVG